MDDTKHDTTSRPGYDRRKHRRYRWSLPIEFSSGDGPRMNGITIELSEGGFSAAVSASLKLGDRVGVTSVGYNAMLAVVRRVRGRAYGFEFLELSPEQQQKIKDECQRLPLYRSSLDF